MRTIQYIPILTSPGGAPHVTEHRNDQSGVEFLSVTRETVSRILASFRGGSSPGCDGISIETLKECKEHILEPLTHIVNRSFRENVFPRIYKKAILIPLFKKGDPTDPSNYRPISLLSVIGKLIEKIAKEYLVNHIESNEILSDQQFGFRKGKSTDDAICLQNKIICTALDSGNKVIGIYMDLVKAFDTISHVKLLKAIEETGVNKGFVNWSASYLSGRQQFVKVGNQISDGQACYFGIPQGTCLGPVYFLIFIDKLLQKEIDGKLISFADDTSLIVSGEDWPTVINKAERCIAVVQRCLTELGMKLNYGKTHFMAFALTNSRIPKIGILKIHSPHCLLNECKCPHILQVESTRYLGVVIDQRLRWDLHIHSILSRMRKLMFICREVRNFLAANTKRLLYFALAQSILMYGVGGWGGCGSALVEQLFSVQKRVIKVLLKKDLQYPTEALFKEFKVHTIRELIDRATVIKTFRDKQEGKCEIACNSITRSSGQSLLKTPFRLTTCGQKCHDYRGVLLFNSLPIEIRSSSNEEQFKTRLKSYFMETSIGNITAPPV